MTDLFARIGARHKRPALLTPAGHRLDETDIEILLLLQTGARGSIQSIADRVHRSASTTHDRIKRLEAAGVILRYMAEIDGSLFDPWRTYLVDIELTLRGRKERSRIEASIRNETAILEAEHMIGELDLRLRVTLETISDWPRVALVLDPDVHYLASTHIRPVAGVVKSASPHPLLQPRRN